MKGLHRHANLCSDLLYMGISRALCICLIFGLGLSSSAQTSIAQHKASSPSNLKYDIQPLSIGDKVPDITFHNVLNYKSKTAKLSDFKGKLVILDMWSVFCTSCIAGFPKMEKLQKEFGDKLQILLVNPHDAKYDSEEKIITTLNKFKTRTGFYSSLPVPIHDSILNSYFPHESVPHQVWIDGDRKIVAITGSNDVTAENIRKLLTGEKLSIAVKNDWAFDRTMPLLVNNNGGNPNDFIYRSVFTGFKEGLGFSSGVRVNENNEATGFYILNYSLREMIDDAFSGIMTGLNNNKIYLQVKKPEQFQKEFDPDYTYCYDLVMPALPIKFFDTRLYLQEELKRYFNIRVYKENRKVKCLVLKATPDVSHYFSKNKNPGLDLDSATIKKYIHNYPVNKIASFLDRFDTPLVDETGITYNLDIDFPDHFNINNKNLVVQFLKDMGLDVIEEERQLEVVVITDN